MELLTKEEGLQYLQDILGIHKSEVVNMSDKSITAATKISFLETIIQAFLAHEPFQSITLMSQDINSRRRPTWDEVKRDLLLGRGGLCYWLNAFMYALLTSLELNAGMTYSTYDVGTDCPNNHLIVLIHDLVAPGSLHLVDVGLGYYIPHVVSLDFATESPEFTDSFMTYKFVKESENKLTLLKKVPIVTPPSVSVVGRVEYQKEHQDALHANKDNNNENSVKSQEVQPGGVDLTKQENQQHKFVLEGTQNNETIQNFTWKWLYFCNPLVSLKKLEPFFSCFDLWFSDITKLSTHTSPRAMCWPNGQFLALVNSKLIQEKETGKLTKTTIIETVVTATPPVTSQSDSILSSTTKNETSREGSVGSQDKQNKSHGESNAADTGNDKNEPDKHTEDQYEHKLAQMEPLVQAYEQYFPQLPSQRVRAALRNWIITGTMFQIPQHLV